MVFADMRRRVILLLIAALLIAGAVVVRVWLAAIGSYSDGSLALPLRVASAAALFGGFLLAGLAVAWPMRRQAGNANETKGGPRGGMKTFPNPSSPHPRTYLTALGLTTVGTAVTGGILFLLGQNVWWIAMGGLISLFVAGAWLGWDAREPEPLHGVLLAVLCLGLVVGALFGGELVEALPDPLPGLAIGDSTFFFVLPLLMLLVGVAGSVLGGRIALRRSAKYLKSTGGEAKAETRLDGYNG